MKQTNYYTGLYDTEKKTRADIIEDDRIRRENIYNSLSRDEEWPCTKCQMKTTYDEKIECGNKCLMWQEWFRDRWEQNRNRLRRREDSDISFGDGETIKTQKERAY